MKLDLYLYEIKFVFVWNHTCIFMKSTFDLYEIRFVFTLILLIPDARSGPGILHLRRSSWDCRNLLGHTWVNEWYNMGNNNQMSDAIWTTTIKRVIQYRPGARIESIIWVCSDIWVFQFYITDIFQTSESFAKSVNLK